MAEPGFAAPPVHLIDDAPSEAATWTQKHKNKTHTVDALLSKLKSSKAVRPNFRAMGHRSMPQLRSPCDAPERSEWPLSSGRLVHPRPLSQSSPASIFALLTLLLAVPASAQWKVGRATWYDDAAWRCYKIRCKPMTVRDNYGQQIDRNHECYNQDPVTVVITDNCPCDYPNNAYSNKRWCCGDMDHFDLGIWAFKKFADPGKGVVGIEYQETPCPADFQQPLNPSVQKPRCTVAHKYNCVFIPLGVGKIRHAAGCQAPNRTLSRHATSFLHDRGPSMTMKELRELAKPSPAQPSPAQPSPAQPSPAQPSPAPSPAQPSPAQPSPAQPSPAQPSPAQPSPAQPSPAQPSPAQPSPAQPSPAQPSPAQPSPAQPSPAQPSPAQPSPAQPSPAQPSPAQPSPAQPSPAQPSPAQPSPAQPSPAQPSPAQPSPAQPSPAQPSPAQPSPAQPSPAQPSPAQPSPAQPSPAQPATLLTLLTLGDWPTDMKSSVEAIVAETRTDEDGKTTTACISVRRTEKMVYIKANIPSSEPSEPSQLLAEGITIPLLVDMSNLLFTAAEVRSMSGALSCLTRAQHQQLLTCRTKKEFRDMLCFLYGDALLPEIDTEARNQLVHSAANQQQVQPVQQRLANLSTVPQQNVAAHGAQAAEQQNFAALGAGQQNVAAQQPSNAAIGAGQQNAASSVPLFSFTPIAGMPISQMGVQCEAAPAIDNTFHLSTAVPTAVPSAPQPQPHAQPQPQPVQQLAQEVAAAATVVAAAGPGEAKTAAINAFTTSAQQLLNAAGRLHAVEPVSRAESAALHVEPTQVARSNVRVTLPVIKKWSSKDLLEGRDFDMFVTDIRRYASALNQELTETLMLHTTDDLRKVVGVKVSQAHSQGKAMTADEVIVYMKELIGYYLHDTKHIAMNRLVQGLVKQQPGQSVLEYAVGFRLEALKAAEVPQPILCDMFVRGLTPLEVRT
ncbi:hypothetical protein QJQ45_011117 [Haematococcus lacustris]|nr:hypothetical protein QJQ45_011117 [Haematococcus lacustris]